MEYRHIYLLYSCVLWLYACVHLHFGTGNSTRHKEQKTKKQFCFRNSNEVVCNLKCVSITLNGVRGQMNGIFFICLYCLQNILANAFYNLLQINTRFRQGLIYILSSGRVQPCHPPNLLSYVTIRIVCNFTISLSPYHVIHLHKYIRQIGQRHHQQQQSLIYPVII